MNEMVFEHEVFGYLKAVMIDENLWFSFRDIRDGLRLQRNAYQNLAKDDRMKGLFEYKDARGRSHKAPAVSEGGAYELILKSRKKEAVEYKRWLTHTILPSIRKNGGYILGQENLPAEEKEALMEQIQALASKVEDARKERYSFLKRAGKAEADCLDLHVSLIEKDERLAEYRRNINDEQFLLDRLESLKIEKEEAKKLREKQEREARIPYAKPEQPDPNPMGFGPDGLRISRDEYLSIDRDH